MFIHSAVFKHRLFTRTKLYFSFLLIDCLLALLTNVQATESMPTDYTQMNLKELMSLEIFTAASMLPTELKKAPGSVYSFDRRDFQRLGVRRLDELLEYVPGFQLNQYRKRHQSIWARGMIDRYNDKMKLLIDGVPIHNVYYGHFSLGENLPLEKIGKVEVILGPASSLYGANAFAGVISVSTRQFSNKGTPARVDTGFELGNHQRAKATAFYNSEKLQAFVSYLDQDAPFADNRKSFIGGPVSQSLDERYKNLYFKAQPVQGLQLSFDYQKNDTPFVFVPENSNINSIQESYNFSADYKKGNIKQGKIEALFYYVDDQTEEKEYEQASTQQAYEEHRNALYYGLKTTWFKQVVSEHTLALGAEWQHDEAKNMNYTRRWHYSTGFLRQPQNGSLLSNRNASNNDYALFIQDVWALNHQFTATVSARYDNFEQFENAVNYRLALVYTPAEQQTIKILWGTAVRKPSYREYLKVLENTSFSPAKPGTEKMQTLELAYAYQWQHVNIGITSFYNEFDDYLHEVATPDGNDEYFVNSDERWRMFGVEMLSVYQATRELNFRASLGWLKAKQSTQGELPYLAEWTASLLGDYQWLDNHHVVLSLFYNSDKEDTNDARFSGDNSDAVSTLNIHSYGKLLTHVSYQLGVKNLMNKKIFDPAGDFDERYNNQKTERELWARLTYSYQF